MKNMGPWPEALLGLCGLELPKGVGQDGWVMDYALLCSGPPGSASTHVQLPEAGAGGEERSLTEVLDILLRCYTMSLAFCQEWFL